MASSTGWTSVGELRDDAQDLAGRRLLLQRFGEVAVASLQLREQPHVLDGDDRLIGEGLEQRDLVVGEPRPSRAVGCRGRRPRRPHRPWARPVWCGSQGASVRGASCRLAVSAGRSGDVHGADREPWGAPPVPMDDRAAGTASRATASGPWAQRGAGLIAVEPEISAPTPPLRRTPRSRGSRRRPAGHRSARWR